MSRHPNVMIQLVLTPLDREFNFYSYFGWALPLEEEEEFELEQTIGDHDYYVTVFTESNEGFDDNWQINGEEGQIIIHRMLTGDYGDTVTFDELVGFVNDMSTWIASHSAHFGWEVRIGANYW